MTTRQTIEEWLVEAVCKGADFVIVVCDTFDTFDTFAHECYDVPVTREKFWAEHDRLSTASMQRIMEVYDLSMGLVAQLDERRANHCPPRPDTED